MSNRISLKETERKVFRSTLNDGLWDILLGCFFLMFAIAPPLSTSLGDFWSSMLFLPFWGLVYLVIWLLRQHVVTPRIGVVKFGQVRKARLMKFTLLMLILNILASILGILAMVTFPYLSGKIYPMILSLIFLIGFSLAAYLLDFKRLFGYGLMVGLAPLVGEWLYTYAGVAHHGFPVTFGVVSGVMILTGIVVFARLLHDNPLPVEENLARGA